MSDLKKFLRKNKDFGQGFEENANEKSSSNGGGRNSSSTMSSVIDYISDDSNPPATTSRTQNGRRKEPSTSSAASKNKPARHQALTELTEEEQLALAIRNSIAENGDEDSQKTDDYNDHQLIDSDYQIFESDSSRTTTTSCADDISPTKAGSSESTKTELVSYEKMLGSAKDECATLKVRLFNADKTDQLVQLRWPSDTRLEALRLYIAQEHSHIPPTGYKLICAFPRTVLDSSYDSKTLKECGLYPSANLHITLDDD